MAVAEGAGGIAEGVLAEEVFDGVGVPLPGFVRDVDEGGPGVAVADGVGGCDEGEGGEEDFVIGEDAGDEECDVECGGAGDGDGGVGAAGVGGEVFFKLIDEGAGVGDPLAVDALFDEFPFLVADVWDAERDHTL